MSVTNEDTTIFASSTSKWLGHVPASTTTWSVARPRSLNRHTSCDHNGPNSPCCNTKVAVFAMSSLFSSLRAIFMSVLCGHEFTGKSQTCQHALDTLVLCFCSFRYVSSTSPVIIVKKGCRLVALPRRELAMYQIY